MIKVEIKRAGSAWMFRVMDEHDLWHFFDKASVRQATEQELVIEYCKSIGASEVVIVQ